MLSAFENLKSVVYVYEGGEKRNISLEKMKGLVESQHRAEKSNNFDALCRSFYSHKGYL